MQEQVNASPVKLKVMCDYFAYPIWDDEFATGDMDLASLPLSASLVEELMEWSDYFDRMLNWDDPRIHYWTEASQTAFDIRGRGLAARVAVELGSGYAVRYWREPLVYPAHSG